MGSFDFSAKPACPSGKSKQCSAQEQNPEDNLVVPRHPPRDLDVEVVRTVACVPCRHSRQWAPPSVNYKDQYLDEDYANEYGRLVVKSSEAENGDGDDTCDKKGPNDCVEDLDSTK